MHAHQLAIMHACYPMIMYYRRLSIVHAYHLVFMHACNIGINHAWPMVMMHVIMQDFVVMVKCSHINVHIGISYV